MSLKFKSLVMALAATLVSAAGAVAQPAFSKVFSPDTIGPGGTSTLTFTITNSAASPVTDLAFTDTLPAGMTIADPANEDTDCSGAASAVLSAPDGGGTISLSAGSVAGTSSCTVTVDVIGSSTDTNASGDLTSSAGNSGSASDILTVETTLPGFTKSFSPDSVSLGGTSTLTFTINNSANASVVNYLDFTDNLPGGVEVANPANASTDCISSLNDTTLTATPGSSTVQLDANGTSFPGFEVLAAGASCSATVDVKGTAAGSYVNSTELLADFTTAGNATDKLIVSAPTTDLHIAKSFLTNPVNAGTTTELEFTLTNRDRNFEATGVTFTDDLNAMMSGAAATVLPATPCGATSTITGTSNLTFANGTIAAGGSCTFSVTVLAPVGATAGTYTNTTSAISGTIDGSPAAGDAATADVLVPSGGAAPSLTVEFLDAATLASDPNPKPGDDVVLRYTVTNLSSTHAASDIAFEDQLTYGGADTGFLPSPVITGTLPTAPCGSGSTLSGGDTLNLTGGDLAMGPAESCTFDVTVTLPSPFPASTYTNATSAPSATVNGATVTGSAGSDTLTVGSAIDLSFAKAFQSSAAPGGTVDLDFTITRTGDSDDVENISFTDDLSGFLALTTLNAENSNTCGGTVSGTTTLTFTGGELNGTDLSCTISVKLDIPAGAAAGNHTNTTSVLSAAPVGGSTETFDTASDDLTVASLTFTKEFLTNPVVPGQTTTLRFEIENQNATTAATSIVFTDNLDSALSGLEAPSGSSLDTCGGTFAGTTSILVYIGGTVPAGGSCAIEVPLLVPASASNGTYPNTTSSLSADQGGSVSIDPAVDTLTVQGTQLELTKEFADDPVALGGTATLRFTLTNLDSAQAASDIEFTDDLDTMLSGAVATGLPSTACNGTASGTGTVSFSGGSLTAGETCSFDVAVSIPGSASTGPKTNTTSDVAGTIGGFAVTGDAATDVLNVSDLNVSFSKSFDGTVLPGGTETLTFTLTNAGSSAISDLSFTDDLDAVLSGLIATSLPSNPCGASSSIGGTDTLTFSAGELSASGGTCSFDVEVTVPAAAVDGTYPNATSNLTYSGLFVAAPAAADLVVDPLVDISVTKTDSVTSVIAGQSTTYSIVVSNAGPSTDPSVTLTDNFPADLSCSYTSAAAGSASGNTAAGSGDLSETLSMPSGSSVTYTAICAVASDATGTLSNTATATASITEQVTGNNSGTDSDTAITQEANLAISKTDSLTSVVAGQGLTYTIVAQNNGPSDDPSATVTDALPASLTGCSYTSVAAGGASDNDSGSGDISDTVSLPSGASVTYTVGCTIASSTTGTLSNTATVAASVTDPTPGNDSDTDSDTAVTQEADLAISKTDGVTSVIAGQDLTYTIVVSNSGPSDDTSASLADTFPADLTSCSYTSAAAGGASGNSASGSGDLAETLSLPSGASVTYTVGCAVASSATGTLSNTASVSASVTDPTPGNDSDTDSDTAVTQEADLAISKTDGVTSVNAGGNVVYTIVAQNNGPSDDTSASVTDNFPGDLSCTYTSSAASGATGNTGTGSGDLAETLSLPSGASVTYLATCAVDTMATGTLSNTATIAASVTDPTSSNDSGTDDDTAVIPGDLKLTKAFSPATVEQGGTTTLTFTLDNSSNVAGASSMAFTDTLPSGVTLASTPNLVNSCNGTVTASAGTDLISLSGGTLATGATCTISVDARAVTPGSFTNTTSTLTSNYPEAAAATAPLTVNAAAAPGFAKAFSPDTIDQGLTSVLTFTIDNSANSIEADTLAFT
ncbi:MAG: DUF11 domain-containing protein, partial [Rhodobacteraceae bacterium]|nr:DUF11 domain-containing protein [Paracoccaceae bacterium]